MNWKNACNILDSLNEPTITDNNQRYVCINLPDILGYQCKYCRTLTKNGSKATLTLINAEKSSAYVRYFGSKSEKSDNIFGS